MKFYVHCEDPELTVVIQWACKQDVKVGTIIELFMDRFNAVFPGGNKETLRPSLYSSNGILLDFTQDISKKIKHLDDIYVKFEETEDVHACKGSKDLNIDDSGKKAGTNVCDRSINAGNTLESASKETEKEFNSRQDQIKHLIEEKNNLAIVYVNNQKYRNAVNLYNEIIELDCTNKNALKGLITCYQRAGRFKDGVKLAEAGINAHKDDFEFLLMKGKCLVASGDSDNAIETLISYCKLSRKEGGRSKDEKHDVQVLLSKAYILKHQKDMAINILQGVLRENQEQVCARVEYASILFSLGEYHAEEAMNVLLTSLAKHPDNKDIKHKFADACSSPDGMRVLKDVAEKAMQDVTALVFLATSLRDCGAINEALELMQLAQHVDPSNALTLLTYVHMLELVDSHRDGISKIKTFLGAFPSKRVGHLTCAIVNQYLPEPSDFPEATKKDAFETPDLQANNTEYTDNERYLLALFFTLIKLLFIKGELAVIPSLLACLEPCYKGRDLHLTDIRNEAAYFNCIAEIFRIWETSPVPLQHRGNLSGRKCIYFLGDSHCIPPAWNDIYIKDEEHVLYPVLSTGTKIWHLRPESKFYPKINFFSSIKVIPDGADVITCFGEIDCREALLVCWEKARYDSFEDGMDAVVQIYLQVLKNLQDKHHWNIYIHPVLPVLDLTRPIVMQFNKILALKLLKEEKLHWLAFVQELLTGDGSALREEYELDGTHVHPSYLSLVQKAICLAKEKNETT